ncbi:hypothetical protein, partial [Lacticaseibacillus casei]|uniref:hypothetical protein n=1 Tax=Lacticaseibacillus casei TaxID=1582 RepID=UPI001EE08A3E
GRSSARSPHGPVVSLAPQLLFDNGLFWDCPQRLANLFLQFTTQLCDENIAFVKKHGLIGLVW